MLLSVSEVPWPLMFKINWNILYNFTMILGWYVSEVSVRIKNGFGSKSYTSTNLKVTHIFSPILPDPMEYGWTLTKIINLYHLITAKNPPVPDAVIELSLCLCKIECTHTRCICKKNNLLCTEMCLRINCSNGKRIEEKIDSN